MSNYEFGEELSNKLLNPRLELYKKIKELSESTQNSDKQIDGGILSRTLKLIFTEFEFVTLTNQTLGFVIGKLGKDSIDTQKSLAEIASVVIKLLQVLQQQNTANIDNRVISDLKNVSERLQKAEQEISKRKPILDNLENFIDENSKQPPPEPKDFDFIK